MKIDLVILFFLALTGLVWADGLFVPQAGGGVVLDGRSLQEQKRLKLDGEEVPLAAVHSAAPVLATRPQTLHPATWLRECLSNPPRDSQVSGLLRTLALSGSSCYRRSSGIVAQILLLVSSPETAAY